jgi:microcystin-dependent protein
MRSGAGGMIGPLKLADGTVTLPGLSWGTDPSTGLYKTTGGFGVAVAGAKVAEFTASGLSGARFLGELIPFTCTAPPALCVLPFGQTLSRTTYADLWTQAQIEIAAGNTLYNNGDGSTTFGIMDVRGRVPAAWDSMGGTAANRLTLANLLPGSATTATTGGTTTLTSGSAGTQTFTGTLSQTVVLPVTSTLTIRSGFIFRNNSTGSLTIQSSGGNTVTVVAPNSSGTVTCIAVTGTTAASWQVNVGVDGSTLGASGGGQTATLVTANLPPYSPAGTITNGNINATSNANTNNASIGVTGGGSFFVPSPEAASISVTQGASQFNGAAQGGQSVPVPVLQPTLVTNYILFAGA